MERKAYPPQRTQRYTEDIPTKPTSVGRRIANARHMNNNRKDRLYSDSHLSGVIIGAAMKVHSELGPGLLENAYQSCMLYEIRDMGLEVKDQVGLPVIYRGEKIDLGYRIDLFVENSLIVELKAVEKVRDLHRAQIFSYLKLSGNRIGLLINFNSVHLKDGIHRIVNGY